MAWNIFELLLQGLHMVDINMSIPEHMDEVAGFEATDVSNEPSQQRIARYVERDPKTHVACALVQLAGELPIGHIKLCEQHKKCEKCDRARAVTE